MIGIGVRSCRFCLFLVVVLSGGEFSLESVPMRPKPRLKTVLRMTSHPRTFQQRPKVATDIWERKVLTPVCSTGPG